MLILSASLCARPPFVSVAEAAPDELLPNVVQTSQEETPSLVPAGSWALIHVGQESSVSSLLRNPRILSPNCSPVTFSTHS